MISFMKRFFAGIRSIFLNGLFTLLPLAITGTLFIFTLRLLYSWVAPIHDIVPKPFQALPYSEVLLALIFIFLIGAILKYLLLHPLIHFMESILYRIPLVKPVYFGIKQLVHAFSAQDDGTFKQVVLVEFPRIGIYSIGFVTGEPLVKANLDSNIRYFHVYVPHVPNPASGFLLIIPESDIKHTNLSRQDALALIISGGIVQTEKFLDR